MTAAEAEPGPTATDTLPDRESDEWVRALKATGRERDAALEQLHGLLLRVARGELALQRGTNRNALYKTMFDARSKLRTALAAEGYLDPDQRGPRG